MIMEENDIIRQLISLYRESFATDCNPEVVALPRAGGDRRYFRISGDPGVCIGTYSPDEAEGRSFVSLSRSLRAAGACVPRVLACSGNYRFYLQEDLGEVSLFSLLGSTEAKSLVKETLSRLVSMQKVPVQQWENCCFQKQFSLRQVMWDLNYFKYEYLKPSGIVFNEDSLEDDFEHLASDICCISEAFFGFMMRDCQSRNVMVTHDGPMFIDFQGGRKGPVLYDAVSFLWQARAGFSSDFRMEMVEFYALKFCEGDRVKAKEMLSTLPRIVLFRTLQVLGAYGFRGLVEHRAHFILSIPGALSNLRELLLVGAVDSYPELKRIAEILIKDHRFCKLESSDKTPLTVEVFSFSYKNGYPDDFSGNGGGFMFDCRAMHNPGRYKQYKELTGRDRAVAEFLEERGEVQAFLSSAWSLTDPAVERYLRRGFTNLQIGFGCTGGQHRSVYCAEATARHIAAFFPEAKVTLLHREHPE